MSSRKNVRNRILLHRQRLLLSEDDCKHFRGFLLAPLKLEVTVCSASLLHGNNGRNTPKSIKAWLACFRICLIAALT